MIDLTKLVDTEIQRMAEKLCAMDPSSAAYGQMISNMSDLVWLAHRLETTTQGKPDVIDVTPAHVKKAVEEDLGLDTPEEPVSEPVTEPVTEPEPEPAAAIPASAPLEPSRPLLRRLPGAERSDYGQSPLLPGERPRQSALSRMLDDAFLTTEDRWVDLQDDRTLPLKRREPPQADDSHA